MSKQSKGGSRKPQSRSTPKKNASPSKGQTATNASGARMMQIATWAGVLIVVGTMTGLITSMQHQKQLEAKDIFIEENKLEFTLEKEPTP